jgi:arginyl-tRNA synthetase
MGIDLLINLLKLVKTGSLDVSENDKKTVTVSFGENKIIVDILDITFNITSTKGVLIRLSEARRFAKYLKEKNLTLCISNRGKIVMKLGKEANPKFSRMITRSGAVEITDIRELRRLDKRLRLK